jgi:hypothetical protein
MNFLSEPMTNRIIQHEPFNEEQVEIVAEFIDDPQAIKVFKPIPDGCKVNANCPLFAVAKLGQPGQQWRIIDNMKNGGQNAHVGKDPVHLPRAKGISEKLCQGGWTASWMPVNFSITFLLKHAIVLISYAFTLRPGSACGIWDCQ